MGGEPFDVDGIEVRRLFSSTSNRGACRFFFDLKLGDLPSAPRDPETAGRMSLFRVEAGAYLYERDEPSEWNNARLCDAGRAIATVAAQVWAKRLPIWEPQDQLAKFAKADACSLFPKLRGFAGYDPYAFGGGPNTCVFGEPSDARRVVLTLKPLTADDLNGRNAIGQLNKERAVERRDGVELHVIQHPNSDRKDLCEVVVFLGRSFAPVSLHPGEAVAGTSGLITPGAVAQGLCGDSLKDVAVAAAKRFAA
ncbi:hypothetical protein [Segniliparus rugosus]|uniref:Uncharacterized protein n=1 Tax=Segniliparus rugosus (strain ATCC BAA-974 / DSM 45345 / CCUG 50838 / CIP 108380 / JCM 13579 / CDC 945) TaxID=679197 RepID=E5XTB2_SEGRC|nr:hypothetical protein [Segniliparus rugosus]EFV12443.1 hypothetical protein HMPREF9336_02734 [Segniliparus rugosus ATCC BAA-974]